MKKQCQQNLYFLGVLLAISCVHEQSSKAMGTSELQHIASDECDLFTGIWVLDKTGNQPLYNSSECPYVAKEFDCQGNGRPDQAYLKYRWQPNTCDLPRFHGQDFLERLRGKKIMFAGDSLSANQWQSLKCMLYAASSHSKYTVQQTSSLSTFWLQENNVTLLLYHSPFLVDLVEEKIGRVLKIDSIEINGKAWKGIDILIFNSWHWWNHRGRLQKWDYIEKGNRTYKDMDRMTAYKEGLATWAKWVDSNINPEKQAVFFQGMSPTHFSGGEWGQPRANCRGQTEPVEVSANPGGTPAPVEAVKEVLGSMNTEVGLLDITKLSQLRKDGHPSVYGLDGSKGNDCSHWCLAGVPDTWNQLLYALFLLSQQPSPN